MIKNISCLVFLAVSITAMAQTPWKPTTAAVTFKIKNAGLMVDGSFSGLVAAIKFDDVNYEKGSIAASIDASTINTGIDLRNKHLRNKEQYFNVAKYPKIYIRSTAIGKEKDGTYKGTFMLTIKDVTKNIAIPFTYVESENNATFKATFTIDRRDYNVGGSSWTMADNVTIAIVINASK
ncbi:MAG: YceI family protein [Bacteroidetes bacterium]|nr:YceI family protein [Bacteroidota bacterium]